ncbi:MAG: hypothetical protein K2N88_02760 [Muribaculaceae bacterium]|nr:hypothetical protein [Muribaculaceae bacterium]
MKDIKIRLISAALVALIFVGCKPTEKNYKAAYDSALAKREQAAAEQMRPASGLLSDDGPTMRVIEGDTIFVTRERIRLDNGERPSGQWAVAVALFKMDTNAKAIAADLREVWPDASNVKGVQGHHYAVISTVETLDSARNAIRIFNDANPYWNYIGLPGAPVVIRY